MVDIIKYTILILIILGIMYNFLKNTHRRVKINKFKSLNKNEAYNELKLLLSNSDLVYLINTCFPLFEKSYYIDKDELICIKDSFLKFVFENIVVFGKEQTKIDYEILNTLLIKITDYNPMDNLVVLDRHNPLQLQLYANYQNNRYYKKRKSGKYYYRYGYSILKKRDNNIIQKYGFSVDEFYNFMSHLTYLLFQREKNNSNNYWININEIKTIDKNKIDIIIEFINNRSYESNIRLFKYDDLIITTDFYEFEENAYAIFEERTEYDKFLPTLKKDKGILLEEMVFNLFSNFGNCYQNIKLNSLETDLIFIYENHVLLIEAKAIKYNSKMKEDKNSRNNCKNNLLKATEQIKLRLDEFKKNTDVQIADIKNNKILKLDSRKYNVLGIIITLDDIYDFAYKTLLEAQQLNFKSNPIIFSVDDLFSIVNYMSSIEDFLNYINVRTINKQDNKMCKDEFVLFLSMGNKRIINNSIVETPVIRDYVFYRNLYDRFYYNDSDRKHYKASEEVIKFIELLKT